jgi:hypothetical protein
VAIYRAESGRRIALIAGVAAILGLVVGLAVGRLTAPSLVKQLNDARASAAPIRSSVEVVRTEYSKYLQGGTDPGGAPAAMDKIEGTFAAIRPSMDTIDSTGTTRLGEAISQLRAAMTARVPGDELAARLTAVEAALDAILPMSPVPSGA